MAEGLPDELCSCQFYLAAPNNHLPASAQNPAALHCFLEVKKTLDLVSNQTLILASAHIGIPLPMLGYLGELYRDTRTTLWISPE